MQNIRFSFTSVPRYIELVYGQRFCARIHQFSQQYAIKQVPLLDSEQTTNHYDRHHMEGHKKVQSMGSQVESEWYKPQMGVDYDQDTAGFDVPSVFREHRHEYSAKPTDVDAYRRQIKYRCGHIGTKELEIVLRDYLTMFGDKMCYAELEQFDDEVLNIENPQLQRYLMNGEELLPEHRDMYYINALVDYVEARKTDFASNVPQYAH